MQCIWYICIALCRIDSLPTPYRKHDILPSPHGERELAVFILEDALSVWTNLGEHLLLEGLCVSSIKTGTRRIICLDELSSVVLRSRRTTEDSSSRRIMRLVPVFILETHNASNNKCLPKFVQTDNASSSIKTANVRKTPLF